MSLISNLKSLLGTEATQQDARSDNPNFITNPSRVKHMLQILVESHVQITIVFEDKSEYTSRILDVSRNDIMLDQLNSREGHNKVTKGATIQINAKHHSVPFNFSASVLGTSSDDGYILSMPEKVYHPQKRAFFRIPLVNVEKYKFKGGVQYSENIMSGYIYDISFGGICVAVNSNSYVKKGVILSPASITLKDGSIIHSDFTICSVRKLPQEGFTRVGCEFLDIKPNEKRNVHKFITECERERAKK